MQPNGPILLELRTDPSLGFQVTVPLDEGQALRLFLPMTAEAAQGLALALLAQPGVGCELKPELAEAINREATRTFETDDAFLKSLGVADASN